MCTFCMARSLQSRAPRCNPHERAHPRDGQSAWIKEQKVVVENDKVAEYRVAMKVSFVVDDK